MSVQLRFTVVTFNLHISGICSW